MISNSVLGGALALWLAAGLTFALPVVRAEPLSAQDDNAQTPAETATADDDDVQAVDVNSLDWSQLNVDAYILLHGLTPKASVASMNPGDSMAWSAKDKANGGSDVSVKQTVSPFWDARVGADMTVVREPATMSELLAEKTANGGNLPQSGGSAWAA